LQNGRRQQRQARQAQAGLQKEKNPALPDLRRNRRRHRETEVRDGEKGGRTTKCNSPIVVYWSSGQRRVSMPYEPLKLHDFVSGHAFRRAANTDGSQRGFSRGPAL